ncbi:hypothetical protein ACX1DX_10360 [Tessaracoccus sp. Y36]
MITEHGSATALGRAHAEVLTTTRRGSPVNLPARFPELLRTLRAARSALSSDGAKTPSSGSEWFLDNYYLIEQALGQVRQDLPAVYYRELPWLARGGGATCPPRTLALAEALLGADELQLDPEQLFGFVDLYQQHSVLTQGDVWALPTMLRVVLLQAIIGAASRLAGLPAARNAPPVADPPRGEDDDDIMATAVVSLRKLDRWGSSQAQISHHPGRDPNTYAVHHETPEVPGDDH